MSNYLLENGTDRLLMEDGSLLLIEQDETVSPSGIAVTATFGTATVSTSSGIETFNLFGSSAPSISGTENEGSIDLTLGVRFESSVDGYILGGRWYKPAAATGDLTFRLWRVSKAANVSTQNVTSKVRPGASDSGWIEVFFDTPVPITATEALSISVDLGGGAAYNYSTNFFISAVNSPPLTAYQNLQTQHQWNGTFTPNADSFPDQSFSHSNYWIDTIFAEELSGSGQTISSASVGAVTATFGSASVVPGAVSISPTGITATATFGTAAVTNLNTVAPSGIPVTPTFGTSLVKGINTLVPSGIVITVTFGTATVIGLNTVSPSGIVVTPTFGTAVVGSAGTISPSGIVVTPTFGTAFVGQAGGPQTVTPTSIVVTATFGTATVVPPGQLVSPGSIISTAVFGTTTVVKNAYIVSPSSLLVTVAFGNPTVSSGSALVAPPSIVVTTTFGLPTLVKTNLITPAGINVPVAFGTTVVLRGAITLAPAGIVATATFGEPQVIGGEGVIVFSEDRKSFTFLLEDSSSFTLTLVDTESYTLVIEDSKAIALPAINMTKRNQKLEPIPIGNPRRIRRFITVPSGYTLTEAWLKIALKESTPDVSAIAFKHITPANVVGQGRIVQPDSSVGPFEMYFDILKSESVNGKPNVNYYYEIKFKFSNGDPDVPEQGISTFFKDYIEAE